MNSGQTVRTAAFSSVALNPLSLAVLILQISLVSCSPTLENRCDDDDQCLAGEACRGKVCVAVDAEGSDVATDPDVDNTPTDSRDLPNDEVDSPDEVDGDDPNTDPESDQDLDQEPELVDGEPVDADTAEAETVDLDDGDESESPCLHFNNQLAIAFEERCLGDGDDCEDWATAFSEPSCTSGVRLNQLIELPLMNGLVDSSVLAYFPFDKPAAPYENQVATAVLLSGPDSFEDGLVGDTLYLSESDNADFSNLPGVLTHWSLAFWFKPDPEDPITGEVVLFSTKEPETDEGVDTDYIEVLFIMRDNGDQPDEPSLRVQVHVEGEANGIADVDLVDYGRSDGWYHFLVTGSPDNTPAIFIDGRLVPDPWEGSVAPIFPDSAVAVLGNRGAADGREVEDNFIGSIDEFLLLNRAMSPIEASILYQNEKPYGSYLTEGVETQPNFADVRVAEVSSTGTNTFVASDIVGVRPGPPPDLAAESCYLSFDAPDDGDPIANCFGADDVLSAETRASTSGRFGYNGDRSLKLNGPEAYFDIGVDDELNRETASRTIEFWFRASEAGAVFSMGMYLSMTLFADEAILYLSGEEIEVGLQPDDQWHHVAVALDSEELDGQVRVFVDGREEGPGCQDGCPDLPALLNPDGTYFRFGSAVEDSFEGLVDDFVFHSGYRYPEEIRRRAVPALPVIRFRVDAQDTGEEEEDSCPARFLDYRLVLGNHETVEPTTERGVDADCIGLLSRCNGYIGWWRFEDSTTIRDSTSNEFHFTDTSSSDYASAPGLYGRAGVIDASTAFAAPIPDEALHRGYGDGLAIEAVFDPRTLADGVMLSLRTDDAIEWELAFDSDSRPIFKYTALDNSYPFANTAVVGIGPGDWASLAISHEFGTESVTVQANDRDWVLERLGVPRSAGPDLGARLYLGSNGTGDPAFDAEIEEIRILDHTLGAGESLTVPPLRALWPQVENPFSDEAICVDEGS